VGSITSTLLDAGVAERISGACVILALTKDKELTPGLGMPKEEDMLFWLSCGGFSTIFLSCFGVDGLFELPNPDIDSAEIGLAYIVKSTALVADRPDDVGR
jgi:hypothetical protein